MSLDALKLLVDTGKIFKTDYDVYIIFHLDERGRKWLKEKTESLFMEAPQSDRSESFVWLDGRRSLIREIKVIIECVERSLEEAMND